GIFNLIAPCRLIMHFRLSDPLLGACWKASRILCGAPRFPAAAVARKTTRGAWFASNASCQRGAHRHQRSPGLRPGKPSSGTGVERSLPRDFEKSRNAALITAQTV